MKICGSRSRTPWLSASSASGAWYCYSWKRRCYVLAPVTDAGQPLERPSHANDLCHDLCHAQLLGIHKRYTGGRPERPLRASHRWSRIPIIPIHTCTCNMQIYMSYDGLMVLGGVQLFTQDRIRNAIAETRKKCLQSSLALGCDHECIFNTICDCAE